MRPKEFADPCVTPVRMSLRLLKDITCGFSDERKLGSCGFGVVYKGVLNGEEVAVKRLNSQIDLDDVQFEKEVTNLIGLMHKNIVQLRGYCFETCKELWPDPEATGTEKCVILAEKRERLLCLEYVPNRSLREHISDASCALEWHVLYDIIQGICYGLHYLHTECNIAHMDLKPENILLDEGMVPKIADFGTSRLIDRNKSQNITKNCTVTLGYMAPEYMNHGLISCKADMFSFGVIVLELLTGSRPDYPHSEESLALFANEVVEKWRDRLPNAAYSQQVHSCVSIGIECVYSDKDRRPTTEYIIKELKKSDSDVRDKLNEVPYKRVKKHNESPCKREKKVKQVTFKRERKLNEIQDSSSSWPWVETTRNVAIGVAAAVLILLSPSSLWSWVVTTLKVLMSPITLFSIGVVAITLVLYLQQSMSPWPRLIDRIVFHHTSSLVFSHRPRWHSWTILFAIGCILAAVLIQKPVLHGHEL